MAKYRIKKSVVDAITFQELVEHGRKHAENQDHEMPWSFDYAGQLVTHENDECYLINTPEKIHRFTPDDVLVIDADNGMYVRKKLIFEDIYELA